jgi:large subunit ribosomal protein L10e
LPLIQVLETFLYKDFYDLIKTFLNEPFPQILMARLRKFCAYRRLERPYTRRSKYRNKAFIKVSPPRGIVRFVMGANQDKKFNYTFSLKSKNDLQIRNLAIESARTTANRVMEKQAGKTAYRMIVRVYPHHILRENPLAAGAGADRMSTGMAHSFGKVIGSAARVYENQTICEIHCNKEHIDLAKKALTRFKTKIPTSCYIEVFDNERKAKL